ncbi:hypothetical protein SAMN04490186_3910 [Pseudomonas grimontii]|uniref:Lipid A biosynthesis lauroyl acyltransferase n=1 Tax=Pseudomonas grimontii TaxID=129847 RepID=A0ABY0TU56_9PSED|nr:hypothetical protein SAMN04490186_3910 [Pseudomonas grimontii]
MPNLFWRLVAKLLARPAVAAWLIARAQRTPYLTYGSLCSGIVAVNKACPMSG